MCCLKYEQDAYEELVKNAPKTDSYVETPDGKGTITEINLLRQKAKVRLETQGGDPSVSYYPLDQIQFIKTGKQRRAEIVAEIKEREARGEKASFTPRRSTGEKERSRPVETAMPDLSAGKKAEPPAHAATEDQKSGGETTKKPRRRRRRRSGGTSSEPPKTE